MTDEIEWMLPEDAPFQYTDTWVGKVITYQMYPNNSDGGKFCRHQVWEDGRPWNAYWQFSHEFVDVSGRRRFVWTRAA